jgi:hypothetical protein
MIHLSLATYARWSLDLFDTIGKRNKKAIFDPWVAPKINLKPISFHERYGVHKLANSL